jgi:hypothetical protein
MNAVDAPAFRGVDHRVAIGCEHVARGNHVRTPEETRSRHRPYGRWARASSAPARRRRNMSFCLTKKLSVGIRLPAPCRDSRHCRSNAINALSNERIEAPPPPLVLPVATYTPDLATTALPPCGRDGCAC